MPRRPRDGSFESRTRAIGKKRSLDNTNNQSRKRRRVPEHQTRDPLLIENNHSAVSYQSESGEASEIEFDVHDSTYPANVADQARSAEMANTNLGRNRLAMGFVRPNSTRQESKSSGEISDDSNPILDAGKSSGSPIEISDDEMEDSEGGMVINLDQEETPIDVLTSDDTRSQESGEVSSPPKIGSGAHHNATNLFVVDPLPTRPMKRLTDLSGTDLDDQLKYAFFHLERDRIDLSRPMICLYCTGEGHPYHDCEEKDKNIFAAPKIGLDTQVRLWISCCVCASKSHLVGDCPYISSDQASRWSLKALDPSQIVNMSLETGTSKLEKEAENRNMRPKGLQIKGRAGVHHAGAQNVRGSSDDEDEPFLRKPVGKRPTNAQADPRNPSRYDRYDPPSNQQPHRGGGQWYNTDSFGRRRSRSPDGRFDSYRPREDHPPPRDNYRPGPSDDHRESYRSRLPSPPHGSRAPNSNHRGPSGQAAGSSVQFSLPTRKGSNTWSQNGQSGNNTPNANGKSSAPQQPRKKKPRGGSRKKPLKGGHVF